jgi:type III secretion protein D
MATNVKTPWWTDNNVNAKALQMTMPREAVERTLVRTAPAARGEAKRHEFRVLTGAHRDAVFALGNDDLLVIGADESCDIYLTDPGVAQRHATLSIQGRCASLRALDGSVTVNDQPVAPSARVLLQPGAEISLGESGVRLRLAGDATEKQAAAQASKAAAEQPVKSQEQPARRWKAAKIALLVLFPLVVAGLAFQKFAPKQANAAAPTAPLDDAAIIASLLKQQNLAGQVKISGTSYGIMLTGVLEGDDNAKLQAALGTVATRVINSTVSGEDLLEQVREVFRTRGYDAAVKYLGKGRVRVDNLDENYVRVQRAIDEIRSDVTQVAELVFASPADAQPPARAPMYDAGRGERMFVRIDADTAYLATAGGSRYFVGSVLPTGHTVLRIVRDAVQVEREGQISWFRF